MNIWFDDMTFSQHCVAVLSTEFESAFPVSVKALINPL